MGMGHSRGRRARERKMTQEDYTFRPSSPVTYPRVPMHDVPDQNIYKKILLRDGTRKAYEILKKICEEFKTKDESILHIWPAYKDENRENPVLVAMTENKNTQLIKNFVFKGFKVVYMNIEESTSDESKSLTKLHKQFSEEDEKMLSRCIREHKDELMKNHSNLLIISASSVLSLRYGTPDARLENIPCIVLYCMCKGFIPFLEEPFPNFIGGIAVDVREGRFKLATGGRPPTEYQPELRSGAAVSAIRKSGEKHDRYMGSIGPIYDHPRDGYMGFGSCAHVFVTDEDILTYRTLKLNVNTSFKENNNKKQSPGSGKNSPCDVTEADVYMSCKSIPVEQPPGSGYQCGIVTKRIIREGEYGKSGVDACNIRITERFPNCGFFPLQEEEKLKMAGFSIVSPPHYNGKIEFDADKWRNQDVLKYGCVTKLTRGVLHLQSATVRRCFFSANHGICRYKLSNQYEILSAGLNDQTNMIIPFAERGDSGSLVYSRDENNELSAIGVISGVTDYGTTIVTPIKDYLEALDIGELTTFKQFQRKYNWFGLRNEREEMPMEN